MARQCAQFFGATELSDEGARNGESRRLPPHAEDVGQGSQHLGFDIVKSFDIRALTFELMSRLRST
jgi:hypothetical protein